MSERTIDIKGESRTATVYIDKLPKEVKVTYDEKKPNNWRIELPDGSTGSTYVIKTDKNGKAYFCKETPRGKNGRVNERPLNDKEKKFLAQYMTDRINDGSVKSGDAHNYPSFLIRNAFVSFIDERNGRIAAAMANSSRSKSDVSNALANSLPPTPEKGSALARLSNAGKEVPDKAGIPMQRDGLALG